MAAVAAMSFMILQDFETEAVSAQEQRSLKAAAVAAKEFQVVQVFAESTSAQCQRALRCAAVAAPTSRFFLVGFVISF